jgi:hypothetical protein
MVADYRKSIFLEAPAEFFGNAVQRLRQRHNRDIGV